MRYIILLFSFLLVEFSAANAELPLAENCDEELCVLPNCRCSSTDIPGNIEARDTPQFVVLTFDDGVNVRNIETYRAFFYGRKNKNNCPAGVTFFVTHEYTDYTLINELYNEGFEIALNSMSHRTPQTFWANASYDDMLMEFADQKLQMSHFANIPLNSIQGMRLPFLQMSGNASFQAMVTANLKYDLSWPTTRFVNPGLWPYTLDYASTQDCLIPPCPTASIPGKWVFPLITWSDLRGIPCSVVHACAFQPPLDNEDEWFQFILTNFERHYLGKRAPFGFHIHEWYIATFPAVQRAVIRFMDLINNLNDAYMVTAGEVIDWIQNPVPISDYLRKECRTFTRTVCRRASCGPYIAEHNDMTYHLKICNTCPRNYPWLGNPLGA